MTAQFWRAPVRLAPIPGENILKRQILVALLGRQRDEVVRRVDARPGPALELRPAHPVNTDVVSTLLLCPAELDAYLTKGILHAHSIAHHVALDNT